MYAVIETGGKQYRVELGTELAVERLDGTSGATINFDRVLLIADGDDAQIGTPTVANALVTAEVVRQDRGEKLIVFKYRPKARHRSKKGHRQEQTVIRVADIRFNGRSAADEAGAQDKEASKARKASASEAGRKAAADQALAAKLAAEADERAAKTKAAEKKATTESKPAAKATAEKKPSAKATTTTKTPTRTTAAKAPTAAKATAAKTPAAKTTAAKKPAAKTPAAKTTAAKPSTPRKTTGSSSKKDE